MKNRHYLDYNATSPFSTNLKKFLEKGDFPFANPSSIHSRGKAARKVVNQSAAYIRDCFGLGENDHHLFFHSGSTEGIGTFFNSVGPSDCALYCQSDHPAVLSAIELLKAKGAATVSMPLDSDGNLMIDRAMELVEAYKKKGQVFLNYTMIHNETGVYWPLKDALRLKEIGAFVHVDATQAPGKIENWNRLEPGLDWLTFSGHKFGALKGVGFSFARKDFPLAPLFPGGGQQMGLRGGTENVLGILSLRLALEELGKADLQGIKALRDRAQTMVEQRSGVVVAGKNAKYGRAVNTLNFLVPNAKADTMLIQFDLNGLEISSGSACSSGSVEASKTLSAMGLGSLAKNGARISFGQDNLASSSEILEKLSFVLKKI